MKAVELKVSGMDCANCAASITKFLERKGLQDVYVNFATSEVRFAPQDGAPDLEAIKKGIEKLGYQVVEPEQRPDWWSTERKFFISAVFTAPLILAHLLMAFGLPMPHVLHDPYVQLLLAAPATLIGLWHFGSSALASLRGGVPNMDVLIFTGGTAALVYSLVGLYLQNPDYYFFETSASIFTLVLLGNLIEKRAVKQSTTAIEELGKLQARQAFKIMPSGTVIPILQDEVRRGDLLQVNTGDIIPADGLVEQGSGQVDESMLTGESLPVAKQPGERVIGASVLAEGSLQVRVSATGRDTVLQQIIELVKTAQAERPNIQRLADRISAIFVPVVIGLSVLTFFLGYYGLEVGSSKALMNAIAVLVISCPCAMGLATPTAVMVGVGLAAKNGILIKGGQTLEELAGIRQMVFDKTGTLTSGTFSVQAVHLAEGADATELASVVLGIERHSSHPLAKALCQHFADATPLDGLKIKEIKGLGMEAEDAAGQRYQIGSYKMAQHLPVAPSHSVYVLKNGALLASMDLGDALKPDAAASLATLQGMGIRPVLLSGDHPDKVRHIAERLGIGTWHGGKMPGEKLALIGELAEGQPTAMIGDGINDAPALAKAQVGISMSNASQVAIQSAKVVLLDGKLDYLVRATRISRATLSTIKGSLFWAFSYNLVAIPLAALGFLNPMWGAIFMAFSDVVVIGNAVRLRFRRF